MNKYRVEVKIWEWFEVEAEDEDQAKSEAIKSAQKYDWNESLDFAARLDDSDDTNIGTVELISSS